MVRETKNRGKIQRMREAHIEGLEELKEMVDKISPKIANKLARQAVHAVAGETRDAMRKRAPRQTGTLRKAIISKRRRGKPWLAVSDVRITHGKNVKHDAWYYHMVEFGTTKSQAKPFIRPTVDKITPQIPSLYRKHFGEKLEKELQKEAKKQGLKV